ncbi:MAG TPA: plasmid replication, integration and excision activator [Pseudonocardia sp.]|nr:plasmid replication, integration and excision activator [Pseudonocardia sp.]
MEDVFPFGAYLVSEVEPVRDFDKSTRERMVQALDRDSGLPVWSVSVLDADPMARKNDKTLTVKIASEYQPVPPEAVAGMPFVAVAFTGLTVTPYVDDKRGRVAYSLRAVEMSAPHLGKSRSGSSHGEAAA